MTGLQAKFDAARRRRWSVIAPAENQKATSTPEGVQVYWAENVRQASSGLDRWVPRRVATAFTILVLGLTVVTVGVYSVLVERANRDQRRLDAAQHLMERAESIQQQQPTEAVKVGLAATAIADTPVIRARLVRLLAPQQKKTLLAKADNPFGSVVVSSTGLAAAIGNNNIAMWNIADPAHLVRYRDVPRLASMLALDSAGKTLLVGSSGDIQRISITDPEKPEQGPVINVCRSRVSSVSVSRDQTRVLVGCEEGSVRLWSGSDAGTGVPLAELSRVDGFRAVALSPDGRTAVTGETVWDLSDPQHPKQLTDRLASLVRDSGPRATSASFSGDGKSLLMQYGRDRLEVIDMTSPSKSSAISPIEVGPWTVGVNIAEWGSDDRSIITSGNGIAIVWSRQRGEKFRPTALLRDYKGAIRSIALSSDSKTALTADDSGSIYLWDISTPIFYALRGSAQPGGGAVTEVAAAPAASILVTLAENGRAVLWDTATADLPIRLADLTDQEGPATAIAVRNDGNLTAVGRSDGVISLWGTANPEHPQRVEQLPGQGGAVRALAFDVHNNLLAAAYDNGTIAIWDSAEPDQRSPVAVVPGPPDTTISALALDDEHHHLGAGDRAGGVLVWDIRYPGRPQRLPDSHYAHAVSALAFSPDGSTALVATVGDRSPSQISLGSQASARALGLLADGHTEAVHTIVYGRNSQIALTSSSDGTAILWSLLDPLKPYPVATLVGHVGSVHSAVFGASYQTVVTGGTDKAIVWDVTQATKIIEQPIAFACAAVGGSLDRDEWPRYIDNYPYKDPCAAR